MHFYYLDVSLIGPTHFHQFPTVNEGSKLLDHKICPELLLYLYQYFSFPPFSNNVSSDHMKIYIIPKCNLQRKFCITSLFTEIKGCLMANLPMCNKIITPYIREQQTFLWRL